MDLQIVLHGCEGVVNSIRYAATNETTIDDLMQKVQDVWHIRKIFQQFNCAKCDLVEFPINTKLQDAKLEKNEKIVVKHSALEHWGRYLEYAKKVKTGERNVRKENAQRAGPLQKILTESGFFEVYPKYGKSRNDYQPEVASWCDENFEAMEQAARDHFFAKHCRAGGDTNDGFLYEAKPKPEDKEGIHDALVFTVLQIHGEQQPTEYFVKCHHFGCSNSSGLSGERPSLVECFGYKFLEMIGVGPPVQFILPSESSGSRTGLYICTEWSDDFQELSKIKDDELSEDALIELYLLQKFFLFGDLHEANCGHWKSSKKAAIVDLAPVGPTFPAQPDAKSVLLSNTPHWGKHEKASNLLRRCDKQKRFAFAKQWLLDKKVRSKIDEAVAQIKEEKKLFATKQIRCMGPNATDHFEDYIDVVKKNIGNLSQLVGAIDE